MSRDALIIGINQYRHSQLGNLNSPAADAEAIAQILEKHGHFNTVRRLPEVFKDDAAQVSPSRQVTRKQLREAIAQLFNPKTKTQMPDTALLYFSGHGWQSSLNDADGYLAPTDANPDDDLGVELQWLRSQLEQSEVKQQIIWLDCCNSGSLLNFNSVTSAPTGKVRDRYFITSSRDFEASYQNPGAAYSVLTEALLAGLDPHNSDTGEVTNHSLTARLEQALKGQIQGFRCHSTSGSILLTSGGTKPTSPTPQPRKRFDMPLQMPPLPKHFVERPEYQQAVRDCLLSTDPKVFGTLVVSAIYGLGGIGKSVLAAKLAHEAAIQARFSDGILWATLGQSPDLLPLLSGWIQALGDTDSKPTAIESASGHLRTLLYDKKALLVVDDVWHPEHLEPFRVGGNDCCVLVTTREARIPDAHRYDLDVMSERQALALMTQKLSEPLREEETQQALAFANRVGYLPLALELAATQIEEGVSWAELFEDFQAEVVRLETLDIYSQEDIPNDAKRRKYSLLACFNLSLKQLSAEQLRQFAWLGIVPEDVNLTQEMATTLWQVTPRQAGAILRLFSAKALMLPGAKQSGNQHTYRLHDLMHDLAQRLLTSPPHPAREGDLPGLGLTKAEAHDQLLERYRAKTQNGQWHTLADDGYIYAFLTWHMEQAKRPDAVHQLLRETNEAGRNGWYDACDAIGKPAGFVNDLARAWGAAEKRYEADPEITLALLFRYALIRTSLNSLASNVPAELMGALVKHQIWQPAQGLAYAQQTQDPWQRAECISALVPYMPESLLPEVLKTIHQINDAAYRSFVLSKLATRFPAHWPDVLLAIRQIQDRYGSDRDYGGGFLYRARALSELANLLPPELLPEALDVTRQIRDEFDRAEALSELANLLPPELLPEALEVIRQIRDESSRASALSELAKRLPELLPEALEVTRQISSESERARALSELAKRLPELLPEALEVTRQISDESSRARALSELAKLLPPELLPEALEVTRQISSESERARALRELAQRLPELLPEALEVTRQISDESKRASALSELAKRLPELLPEALEVTRQISAEWSRARALSELAKQLPPELLPEALEVTRQISAEWSRARALSELAKRLPPELLPEALDVTRQISDESDRARALSELAKRLPELLPEALEVTRQISDEYYRARALSELAKLLQPELLPEALEVTRQISDESNRARALIELAKRLPPELLPEALDMTRHISSEFYRARALSELAKWLPELLPEALDVTRQISSEFSRARALIELAKRLPPELLPEALEVTRQISAESDRASALSELAKQLPELLPEALEVTRQISDEYSRAWALSELAKRLPELMPEALEVTRQISDEWSRAWALSELAKRLPPDLLPEALEVTRQISSESDRARALSALAKQLPPELLPEALEVTRQISAESDRARALSGLAKRLPPELLKNAFSLIEQFGDKYHSASAWQGFLLRLEEMQVDITCFAQCLDTLAYRDRQHFLGNLPDLKDTLARLGGQKTLSLCLEAMREVCAQWP
ncbi:NB-ARC domain-containing protein [Leptothoe sp. PORK10 BA2]|uniref:NB-ARC domain-containing protein n=1 Tax=Leptothoe sp. PORK10 BA2 TaxID=3110254 RepID=UPI002B213110|nr:NB-ARC domain-containing protein [Leptothoe sp. PORK10 BA2]MEA5464932.1 NB-ARC domain-containing protein [Leptothoe sp. PORK10 BA2]